MSELQIGQWVRRAYEGTALVANGPKWHLVESVVAGDAVTRCGRRLRDDPAKPFEVADTMPLTRMIGQPQLCRAGCQREDVVP